MLTATATERRAACHIRPPRAEDGVAVHDLIARCPPLDTNSLYCNLLQCTHFARTCAVAELGGELVGFASAYRLPDDAERLFAWQVAVGESARGLGLAGRMYCDILARPSCRTVRFLHATVTGDNEASWAMFERLAARLGAAMQREEAFFDTARHFAGRHDSEYGLVIGPFDAAAAAEET